VFNQQKNAFEFFPGPVFTQLLLADEINRAPAKTQAALLEAMQERSATIDGLTRGLPVPFFVIATQNPIESQGTYPLPEAQLDRFLFKIEIGYPTLAEEVGVVVRATKDQAGDELPLGAVTPVLDVAALAVATAGFGRGLLDFSLLLAVWFGVLVGRTAVSSAAILLHDLTPKRYPSPADVCRLFFAALVDPFLGRPLAAWWTLTAVWRRVPTPDTPAPEPTAAPAGQES